MKNCLRNEARVEKGKAGDILYIHSDNHNFLIYCYHDYVSISLWMPQALANSLSQ